MTALQGGEQGRRRALACARTRLAVMEVARRADSATQLWA